MEGSNMNVGHIGRSLCTWDSATISKIFLCCSDWVMFSLDFTVCQSYPLTLQFPIANVYEFVCVSVYLCACVHMCMYVYVCADVCISVCTCLHVYCVFIVFFLTLSVPELCFIVFLFLQNSFTHCFGWCAGELCLLLSASPLFSSLFLVAVVCGYRAVGNS